MPNTAHSDTTRVADHAARVAYGRLLGSLSSRTHDIAAAEDALADAFAKALTTWPEAGVPQNPDAWLLTVARNSLTDRQRRAARFPTESDLDHIPDSTPQSPTTDPRLSLLMVCAHPAIAADLHTPLMLQTVLGLDAATIAGLFLVSPAALTKRLSRAKAKIRDAGIPFTLPDTDALADRAGAICEAIYALHAHDWLAPNDALGEEALYLADLLCQLMPDHAEAHGLAAVIAFGHARRDARVVAGVLVPTETQDMSLWDNALISYGNRHLHRAFALSKIGRFQIEAAIEAVHLDRKDTGQTDWAALNKLYHAYLTLAPSAGAQVSQAVVTAHLHGAKAGLTALDVIETEVGTGFQPLWAVRAELLSRADEPEPAKAAYDTALSLTTNTPTARFLKAKRAALG